MHYYLRDKSGLEHRVGETTKMNRRFLGKTMGFAPFFCFFVFFRLGFDK